MDKRDIALTLPASSPFFKLNIVGGVLLEDNVLQRIITLLLIHNSPNNEYTLDGLHPQELVSMATTAGMDSYLERLNIIGGSIVSDINNDLMRDGADPSEEISSIAFAAREGESPSSPRILVRIVRVTGEQTIAELRPHE